MVNGERDGSGSARRATSKVVVVLPAYNAEKTLERTCAEIPRQAVDEILLVDDASRDRTVEVARRLGILTLVHAANRGYGANQKTCYRAALERGADIVVMLHPDYQYPPQLIPAMVALLRSGLYDVVLGSRILVRGALRGGMPLYKYIGNRVLTMFENLVIGRKLSEYHTGFRAYRREVLENLPIEDNADGFVFDNQILCQAIYHGFSIGEISSPCRYFPEASSIGPLSSLRYAAGVVLTSFQFRLNRWGLLRSRMFAPAGAPASNSHQRT
ncbi:MAG TPA: glycosyltransferase family 2 protein [Candidatus Polarisedimenticolia bacterium]|nr:glycosyltransferase family 2 protein [Candidatus Polarisedimenticolia bacterium]